MSGEVRILIAEHDPMDVELMLHELSTGGIRCVSMAVKNEQDYTHALNTFAPDIILSDYSFPDFDGAAAFTIRERMAPHTPFIFVSGTIGEEKAVGLIRDGVTDYVLKDRLQSLPIKIKRALKELKDKQEKDKTSIALQHALKAIEKIMDSSLDVICTISEAGCFVQVSAACETVWGYAADELIGKPIKNFIYPEDYEKTREASLAVMAGKNITNFENRYVHRNGSLVWMVWSSRWNAKDRVRYAVARDATEKKVLEKALETEKQRFYDLFQQAPSCIGVLKGPEHVYEMVNPFYLQLIGKTDVIGQTVKTILPEVVGQGFIEILDEVYRTGNPFFAEEMFVRLYKTDDGILKDTYLNIVYQAYRNMSGCIEGIFFFTVDVTEQVLSRKKIEESEKRYRQIVETAQEGIWLTDENNNTLLVNKKMADILGYSQEEMIGRNDSFFMDAEFRKKVPRQSITQKSRMNKTSDFKYITKDGKEVWTNLATNLVFDDFGQYKGALSMVTDITERKKAEDTLIKRDNQLTLAINMARLGYWEFDVVNDLFTFNDQFYTLFKTTAEKVGGYTMTSARYAELFVHPDEREVVGRSVKLAIASKDASFSFKSEHRVVFQNGEHGYISVHFYIVKDASGRTIKNFGVNQDITERRKAEEEIKESNQRFKYVTKATSDAIWDWDLTKQTVYWGEGFESIFGHTLSHVKRDISSWTDYIHPDDIGRVLEKVYAFINGAETNWVDQYRYRKSDQVYAYVVHKGFVLRDLTHKATRMLGALQDITKQQQEEQRLKLLESVIVHSNDAVLITEAEPFDEPGPRIVYVNEAFTKMTGYAAAEVIGKSPRFLQGEKTNRDQLKQIDEALRKWQPCETTTVNYKKNGAAFWNNFSLTPLADSKGWFTHWIAIERDVSAHKQSEIQMQELNEKLRMHVKALALSNAELEQFAYVASHDLQEPLRMVTSFLSQLEKKYAPVIDDKGRQYIAFAVDGAKRMRQIILDLLEFSRVGKIEAHTESVDLNALIKDIKVLFRKQIEEKKAVISTDQLPILLLHHSPMLQVFQNLVGNALKYTAKDRPSRIHISARELSDHWEFAVSDNGIGIKKDYFEKIFIIFQRLHNKDQFSGTGIGLAVTKKILENLGGRIWVESTVGEGSIFFFTLTKPAMI